MTDKAVFAVGLGFYEDHGVVRYKKAFTVNQVNAAAVTDFINILSDFYDYSGENEVFEMNMVDYMMLLNSFENNNHKGSAEFINEMIKDDQLANAFFCIMHEDTLPENAAEAYLILELFSIGTFNALNEKHRTPLTKIFGGLQSVNMTIGGYPSYDTESSDKFVSHLYMRNPDTNRFAPTSFARYGAHFGKNNTLMMGAAVNIGVSIGDENLLDGHCSIASCVQIGHRNKIGSFVSMEGVLSPVNEKPVIVGDDNFFGTRCRIGTGLVIGNKNFWGSGVDVSVGTPLKDLRENSSTYGEYVKAGSSKGIQSADNCMLTFNNSYRKINGVQVYPGEILLNWNNEKNQARFTRNDDLTENN